MSLWPAIAKLFAAMVVVWLVTPIVMVWWCGRQCRNKGDRMKRVLMALLVASMIAAAAHSAEAFYVDYCGFWTWVC